MSEWKVTVRKMNNTVETTITTDSLAWANQIAMWASQVSGGRICTIDRAVEPDRDYGAVRDSCNAGRTVYIKTATGCWLTDMDAERPVYIHEGHLMSPVALVAVDWPLGT